MSFSQYLSCRLGMKFKLKFNSRFEKFLLTLAEFLRKVVSYQVFLPMGLLKNLSSHCYKKEIAFTICKNGHGHGF